MPRSRVRLPTAAHMAVRMLRPTHPGARGVRTLPSREGPERGGEGMSPSRCIDLQLELPCSDDMRQPEPWSPERTLLLAVMYRAWADALDDHRVRAWWTERSPWLRWYCAALDLDLLWVVRRARERLRRYDEASPDERAAIRGRYGWGEIDVSEYEHAEDDEPDAMAARRAESQRRRRRRMVERMDARFPGYAERHARKPRKV